jgi:hypothetical protein
MPKKSWLVCTGALLAFFPISARAATPPTLYALSQRTGSAELFSYDLTQDVSSSLEYRANLLAPFNTDPFDPSSITAMTVGGNTLYALSQRPGSAELFTYDLNQDVPSSLEWRSNSLIPFNTDPFDPAVVTSITTSRNTLYALAKLSNGSDELFTYDLTQDVYSSLEWQANSLIPLNTSPFSGDTITAIVASDTTLYALSQRPGSAELFTYDLSQDVSSSLEWQASSLIPFDTSPFDPGAISSLAISGNILYALAKLSNGTDELFTYDLTQDVYSSLEWQANSLIPMNTDPFDGGTITAIAASSPMSSPPPPPAGVPEPGSWALMLSALGLIGYANRRRNALIRAPM